MKHILICSSHERTTHIIQESFKKADRVIAVNLVSVCLEYLEKRRFDILFIDVTYFQPAEQVKEYKQQLSPYWEKNSTMEIILLTSKDTIHSTVELVKAGASDYLTYPIDPHEIQFVVEAIDREQQLFSELKYLRDHFWHRDSYAVLKTRSPKMQEVFNKIRAVAPTESTVLLLGETGTGKGVIANLIHRHSIRCDKQFIQIHCGAITDTILESEMFGHEKGAFTGATRRKLGKFEIASGGTLFLDEIGTISSSMQINLLQVLQYRSFQRVGGESEIQVNVRLIAATNADLQELTAQGLFRQDLFFRLNVFPIVVPPLRDRLEDIPILIETFLEKLNKSSTKKIRNVEPKVLKSLREYHWPGNIRELENLIERAYVLAESSQLTEDCFPAEMFFKNEQPTLQINASNTLDEVRQNAIEAVEKSYLTDILTRNHGRIDQSAISAGIGVRQLHKLLKKYEIEKSKFKKSDSDIENRNSGF